MTKPPPDLPKEGDRVKLRGKDAIGKLEIVTENNWARVAWDWHFRAPQIVHLYELERLQEA